MLKTVILTLNLITTLLKHKPYNCPNLYGY